MSKQYDTIRFSVPEDFDTYVRKSCDDCELQYCGDPTGYGDYLYAIEPQNVKEWHMAHGIESQVELYRSNQKLLEETNQLMQEA